MPTRQESAVVTCGGSRVPTNPLIVPLGFDGGTLMVIRIVIPTGHAGLTGIALGYGGNATVPFGKNAYYSGDGREIIINFDDNVTGVSWSAFLCNNDLDQHFWEVDMDFNDGQPTNQSATIAPIPVSAIEAAGAVALGGP